MLENILFNGLDLLGFMQAGWVEELLGGANELLENTGGPINSFMVNLINVNLLEYGGRLSNHLIGTARALGAIFAICVAAAVAYKTMAKGEPLDVLKIMRPLMFAFILSIWPAICNVLIWPGKVVENHMRTQYVNVCQTMVDLQEDRKDLALKVLDKITEKKKSAEDAKDSTSEDSGFLSGIMNAAGNLWENATNVLTNWLQIGLIYIMYVLEWIICQIGEMCFAVCVYIVFLVKVLYITVLWMFGPVYMVCSILDVWENSWSTWVSRIITVSMFGAMAYLVMTFACFMICMTLKADISRLNVINVNPDQGLGQYLMGGFGTTIMTAVGYFVGGIAMTTVGELASFTWPGGNIMMGAGNFISGMKSMAMSKTGTRKLFS